MAYDSIHNIEPFFDTMLALNNANTPHVNALTGDALQALIGQAAGFRALVGEDERLAGFMLLIGEGQSYQSLNYQWFSKHMTDFLYVDRIVIEPEHRGLGAAVELYAWAKALASSQKIKWLTCEVNLSPPNPRSIAFHQRQGFSEIGQQKTDGGQKTVSLMRSLVHA
ncbi:MAG: GNAT family N-acetyltransferase [Proteobacteria bacterium]|nr:GNAT family N-acetyltransferase [Pseudomonadota bacterium]MDA1208398.1 GNAT family N-acetyltransferase [Pseudomonadota bacterium]